MAQEIVMPKLGNTVESVLIVEWHKDVGDPVAVGERLCEVETDKATVDVEAESAGTLLSRLFAVNDEVPVMAPFAVIGEAGESPSHPTTTATATEPVPSENTQQAPSPTKLPPAASPRLSPRARNLVASSGLSDLPASGSGPGGRIIERDILALIDERSVLRPTAKATDAPESGTGRGITSADLSATDESPGSSSAVDARSFPGPVFPLPVTGMRQVIARRMHASLAETAQLTLNTSVDATSLLQWRADFKNSPEKMGVSTISINDLIMFTAARLLPKHPLLNATFSSNEIRQYKHVHLGFAVDTPRGLMVPVIRYADTLSLSELSIEARRLAEVCRNGKASPDQLSGGTFTITNLGAFGVESFTPVLNTPEVAILGVGTLINTPIEMEGGTIGLGKRMGLSLTIDHQAVDGAPGARFLQDLTEMLAHLEWALVL